MERVQYMKKHVPQEQFVFPKSHDKSVLAHGLSYYPNRLSYPRYQLRNCDHSESIDIRKNNNEEMVFCYHNCSNVL